MRILLAFLTIVLLAATATACNDDSNPDTTVRSPSSSNGEAHTSIPELDHTLNAALAGDKIELAGLTGYQHIGCVAQQVGNSPPACRPNETLGMEVEAFPVLQCELAWIRPEVVPDAYAKALGTKAKLVAVFRPVSRPFVLEANYIAVFDTDGNDDTQTGVALSIKEGRVIQIEYQCSDFAALYAPDKVSEFVVAPPS